MERASVTMRAAYRLFPRLLLVQIVIACLLLVEASDTRSRHGTAEGGEHCLTPQGRRGACGELRLCPQLLARLLQNRTSDSDQFLRNSICAKPVGHSVRVCCEQPTCATEDGRAGACTERRACAEAGAARGDCSEADKVCCARRDLHDGYVSAVTALPEFGFCGDAQPALVDNVTPRGQQPWSALLVHRVAGQELELCGGALVGARFVLTAAHCVQSTLVSVRLGVYNIGERCVDVRGGCPLVASVANVTFLPTYNATSLQDDLALLTLASPAPYSKTIRPICLPDRQTNQLITEGAAFVTSGWGVSPDLPGSHVQESLKTWTQLPARSRSVCKGALVLWEKLLSPYVTVDTSIPAGSLCFGGTFESSLCLLDSGGPLAWQSPHGALLVALHSRSAAGCRAPVPAIFTPVLPHVDWIVGVMRSFYSDKPH